MPTLANPQEIVIFASDICERGLLDSAHEFENNNHRVFLYQTKEQLRDRVYNTIILDLDNLPEELEHLEPSTILELLSNHTTKIFIICETSFARLEPYKPECETFSSWNNLLTRTFF